MSDIAETKPVGSAETQPPVVPQDAVAAAPPVQPPPDDVYKVYRPPRRAAAASADDLPDDYFTPSPADLKAAQAALHARTQALVNAPLQTRAVREKKEKERLQRWPNTTIRVRFSDQTQLEKSFPSNSKIRVVYAFVRGALREDVKPIKFVLSQSPPLRELKVSDPKVRDLSLAELQLAPSSVLLLKFEDDSLNHSTVPAPLAPDVLSQAIDLPPPPTYDGPVVPPPPRRAASSSTQTQASSSSQTGGGKKVPKWFKMGPGSG